MSEIMLMSYRTHIVILSPSTSKLLLENSRECKLWLLNFLWGQAILFVPVLWQQNKFCHYRQSYFPVFRHLPFCYTFQPYCHVIITS